MTHRLTQLQWLATTIVFFTGSWWWRPRWLRDAENLPAWMTGRTLDFLHFGYTPLVVIAIAAWLLTRLRGLDKVANSWRMVWAILLLQLAVWALVALPPDARNHDVGLANAYELLLSTIFLISVLSNAPPLRWVLLALIGGMVFQAVLGIVQTHHQADLDIRQALVELGWRDVQLYELKLDPARSGVSVVQAEGVRFLRPYGVSAHPNFLAGALVMGLCATFGWWLDPRYRRTMAWVTALGLWALLLTFSRAAWGGLAVGAVVGVVLYGLNNLPHPPAPSPHAERGSKTALWEVIKLRGRDLGMGLLLPPLILTIFTGILFIGMYFPLIAVRSGAGTEGGDRSIEAMSLEARAVYEDQARQLIRENPWRGVGIGNFAWESAYLLFYDWRDLHGDNVHNIYLLVLAEVGAIGFVLWAGAWLLGSWLIVRQAWRGKLNTEVIGLFMGVVALLALGWFDHYPWTQFGFQLLLWGGFATALHHVEV